MRSFNEYVYTYEVIKHVPNQDKKSQNIMENSLKTSILLARPFLNFFSSSLSLMFLKFPTLTFSGNLFVYCVPMILKMNFAQVSFNEFERNNFFN